MKVPAARCWVAALLFAALAGGELAAQAPPKSGTPSPPPHNGPAAQPAKPAEPPPASAEPPAPAPAAQAGVAIGEFQPVLHAQEAKIGHCMDTIVAESASVIDTAHTAISSWTTAAPDDNLFVSIIGLSYANKAAPNGAAVILAAPTGGHKCEGETVQIYPLAQSCSSIQASLIKEGRTVATLRALPVVETKAGVRNVLIPSAGGG